ncbi:MAG TPA: 30S ribosomal protein S5 [Planctomycetota bacterium]|jgi:small subunit ribosomal protein S5|nr:30S ribosomal protein S5 [Planctomycetota bacterium]MDP6129471.1 30S ribosomal protein S5 [Planctomycetota bacterium]MDP7245996.1 30S ribosomal protein S5 [Planctomycetota bacterium]HJM38950.1 30S ribosomal protein S5 [Planctomycetota bacterium]|tara:strand:- start:5589 stop:6107 length:519 start_codon:yes stop_codon:yes gene_type:complete
MSKNREKTEFLDRAEAEKLGELKEERVKVNRTAKVVKGGRRFAFSALTVVGNQDGVVGYGFGKAKEIPMAMQKAFKDGRKHLVRVPRVETTIPHEVEGEFCASRVRLIPASPGTGIIAGGTVRAVMELAGVKDILTKSYGSTNPINLVKATVAGLALLRTRAEVSAARGVEV